MGNWKSLKGTSLGGFFLGLAGVFLKNSNGDLTVRNHADSADAAVTASKVNVSGDSIDINSDAAGSGNDFKVTLARNAAQTTAYTLTLPANKGASGQALGFVDDNGTLGAVDAGNTTVCEKVDSTAVTFGSSSPIAAFTRPANSVVTRVEVAVDTAFNGTAPALSVGIAGNTAKYMPATALDLKTADVFEYVPGLAAEAASEDIIITFSGDSSTQGSARVQVFYAIPG